ncbi:MAG: hypothetical protein ACK47M_05465 [Caldilinea sp.]
MERIDRLIGLFEISSDFKPLLSGQSSGSQKKGSQDDKKQMKWFRQMAEIGYKEYRLLGKVVRKIEEDSEETIDLLRGTGLGGVWIMFNPQAERAACFVHESALYTAKHATRSYLLARLWPHYIDG